MGDTGQINVRVESIDDLLAVAEALEHEAAARYRELAARMTQQGDEQLAAQFDVLAKMEDRHAVQIGDRSEVLRGRRPDPNRVVWDTPPNIDEDVERGAEISPYQALAYAVRNEERAFAFYAYLSAEAQSAEIQSLAEDMARDELQHAALLRQYRRRAFHADRPLHPEMPETFDELQRLARRWDAEASLAHAALAQALDVNGEAADAAIFRRLAEEESLSASGEVVAATAKLRSAADGLRLLEEIFDRYALIAERADEETLLAEAQRLANCAIARLASVGGARSNSLLA
jgi:rubrerythrin